jgi:4-diphosphocytidyl-2-C-methyl-D-erythritol kinase
MSRVPDTISRDAPAKINLGLRVLRRRPDRYHDVETVLLPLEWADELHIAAAAGGPSITCDDPTLPTDERNLVVRAAAALAAHAGVAPAVAVSLAKRVPYGAGLGGGSSDAAATLTALRDLWRLETPDRELRDIAANLGSDVPFFLGGGAAFATGRGDQLEPLVDAAGMPWRMPFAVTVAVPPVRVPTAEAYGWVTPNDADRPDLRAAVLSNDPARWRREIVNDFQEPVTSTHREIARALSILWAEGAESAALSGSGSAVFGVFQTHGAAGSAGAVLARAGCSTFVQPAPG